MHIHIIGIAGTMTAALAKELKNQGHLVTGSDQDKIYPPVSNILKNAGITVNNASINNKIDLVIVGSSYQSFSRTITEFETVKKINIPYVSATEFIAKNVAQSNSILVAGTFGKTTITSLLAWILYNAKLEPSYMFGGKAKNNFPSLKISNSDWSVIEADESIHGLDEQAKFHYYPIKYLLLTSAEWEHKDCYHSEEENFLAFKKLVEKIPADGILLINSNGQNTQKLSSFSQSKIISYGKQESDFSIEEIKHNNTCTNLKIKTPFGLISVNTHLIGQYNFENILAAVSLALTLGIDKNIIAAAVESFKGIKRRLDLISSINNCLFFDDFAQSATRVKSVLESLKDNFPNYKIKVLYQPHATILQNKESLGGFSQAFSDADEIILGKLRFNNYQDKTNRVTAIDFVKSVGSKLTYLPLENDIIAHYKKTLTPNTILVHMSSGGLQNLKLFKKIIKNFKTK